MLKLFTPFIGGRAGTGLLIFRVVTGAAMMIHGFSKIQQPFSWMDKMNMGVPPLLQMCAALAEFGGGMALILGLLTPIACLGIALTMLGAIFMVHVPKGGNWIGGPNEFEAAASYLTSSVLLFLTGPGTISLDAKIFGHGKLVDTPYVTPKQTIGTGV